MTHTEQQHPRTRSQWRSAQSRYSKAGYILLGLLVLSMIFGERKKPDMVAPTPVPVVSGAVRSDVVEEKKVEEIVQKKYTVFDISDKTKDEILLLLGTGTDPRKTTDIAGCEKTECLTVSYLSGEVEITYVGGKSNVFTITPKEEQSFDSNYLSILGLEKKSPTKENDLSMTRVDIQGIDLVQFFKGDKSNIGYIYIKKIDPNKSVRLREEKISKCFSARDGSVRSVTNHIKDNMNDPSSYEHVKTFNFKDPLSELEIIYTEFRGKNVFGALVKNAYVFGINEDCSLVKTYTKKEQENIMKKLGF